MQQKSRKKVKRTDTTKGRKKKAVKSSLSNAQIFTSNKKDWTSPEVILSRVRKLFKIGLDPCSNPMSIVRARREWSLPQNDGLSQSWGKGLRKGEGVFVNWPYGQQENPLWAAKVATEVKGKAYGAGLICLVANRSAETWYQDHILAAKPTAIGQVHKRLRFSNAKHVATFPSIVVYYGNDLAGFKAAFGDICAIWPKPRRGNYPFGSLRRNSEFSQQYNSAILAQLTQADGGTETEDSRKPAKKTAKAAKSAKVAKKPAKSARPAKKAKKAKKEKETEAEDENTQGFFSLVSPAPEPRKKVKRKKKKVRALPAEDVEDDEVTGDEGTFVVGAFDDDADEVDPEIGEGQDEDEEYDDEAVEEDK